jgi:predicted P-loop ATPase
MSERDPATGITRYDSREEAMEALQTPKEQQEALKASLDLVRRSLISGRNGAKSLFDNVVKVLEMDPDLSGSLRWNDLHLTYEWQRGDTWETISDAMEGEICSMIERRYEFGALSYLHKAIVTVANRVQYSPVEEYLKGLEWDGAARISTWIRDYCGGSEGVLQEAFSRRFLIGAVARALRPGCKLDHVLILRGAQGIGKSTILRMLASAPWFSDTQINLSHHQDRYQALAGVWIYELAELAGLSKAATNSLKGYLSSEEDRFRPSHATNPIQRKRRNVFAGTSNDEELFRDPTGNRRFWVSEVQGPFDLEGIRRDRDQIWAEAVAAFRAGEQWWIDGDLDVLLQEANESYAVGDTWEEAVALWVQRRISPFPVAALLSGSVEIDLEKQGHQERARAVKIMVRLGCRKRHNSRGNDFRQRTAETRSLGLAGGAQHWYPPSMASE